MAQLVVRVRGRQLQLQDEPVDLVDAHGDRQPLLHRVLDQPLRVQHHLGDTGGQSQEGRQVQSNVKEGAIVQQEARGQEGT